MIIRLLALFVLSVVIVSAAPAKRPNIVLIFIDDMGYGDIGPFGSVKNRTPRLDRMAAEGMRFTSFYAAPVCSVSRAQVLTGCYGQRVSVPGVFFPAGKNGLNPEENTVAELMREAGYATACVGKWHLGDQPEFLPTNHGFDYYYGIPYSNDMNRKATDTGKTVCPLLRNDQVIELLEPADQARVTADYTEEAIKFIREHREGPFFVYLPHTAVHVPIWPGKPFAGKSANGRYGDWVEELDWSTGRILDTLRELGIARNTLVIFTSDNGPWLSKGSDGGESGPLRGGKGGTFEGGVREPTIAWWPGTIAAGTQSDIIAGNIDFLPTFVSLAGGELPEDRKIDGRDFSAVMLGEAGAKGHDHWFYYRGYGLKAVRSGEWKLALGPQSEGMGLKNGSADASSRVPRLYHLGKDIGERHDVAGEHPDVVARLTRLAADMVADLGNGKAGPGVRPAGYVANPVMLYPAENPVRRARKKAGKPVDLASLKVGDAVPAARVPNVSNAEFTLRCEVTTDAPNGIIVSHGGSRVGWSLYLRAGRPIFALRRGERVDRVKGAETVSGQFVIAVRVAESGEMTMEINGSEVGQAKAAGALSSHPAEDLCVGHDDKNPADPEAPAVPFAGLIRGIRLERENR